MDEEQHHPREPQASAGCPNRRSCHKFACYMWEGYTTAHRTRVRHMRHARLEAGRLQRMRHARARLEIVVVRIEAVLRLLPVRLEIGVVVRVDVGEVAAVPPM